MELQIAQARVRLGDEEAIHSIRAALFPARSEDLEATALAAQLTGELNDRASARELVMLRWGLVPFWAKDPGIGNKMINARAETAHEKPAFRNSFTKRRCLVVTDGFYEWKKEAEGKQPYWIHRPDGRPFAFAGLWSRWDGGKDGELAEGEEPLETFTILTCPALPELREVHHRMPVILAREDQDGWLDPANHDRDALAAMLRRPVGSGLELRRVSRRVNSPANDTPDLLREMTD